MAATPQQPPSDQLRDPIGEAIRGAFRDAGLRIGALAGLLITVGSWLVAFGLSWLPGAFTAHALGIVIGSDEHVSIGPRVAASLFAPWVTAEHFNVGSGGVFIRADPLIGAAVVIALLSFIGWGVRLLLPALRSRAIALLVAALGSASALAIASAFVSYRIGTPANGGAYTVSHASSSLFWMPLLWIGAVGLFSFGVVARLHTPLRVALRNGALAVGLVATAAAIAFPVVVVNWAPIDRAGNTPQHVNWSFDLAEGFWHWGPGVSGVAVPLAFGADAHLPVAEGFSPFEATTDASGQSFRLPALAKYMGAHSNARLTGYAATGGTAAHVVLLLGAALVLLLFALTAVRTVRRLGAPRAIDGLRHGLLVGLAAFLFVLALKWMTAVVFSIHAATGHSEYRWGLNPGPLFQTGGELLGLCGLSGLLYAALKPRAYRYQPWRPAFAFASTGRGSSEKRVAAHEAEPTASTPPASIQAADGPSPAEPSYYCSHCGHRLRAEAAFCARCGAPVREDAM